MPSEAGWRWPSSEPVQTQLNPKDNHFLASTPEIMMWKVTTLGIYPAEGHRSLSFHKLSKMLIKILSKCKVLYHSVFVVHKVEAVLMKWLHKIYCDSRIHTFVQF